MGSSLLKRMVWGQSPYNEFLFVYDYYVSSHPYLSQFSCHPVFNFASFVFYHLCFLHSYLLLEEKKIEIKLSAAEPLHPVLHRK